MFFFSFQICLLSIAEYPPLGRKKIIHFRNNARTGFPLQKARILSSKSMRTWKAARASQEMAFNDLLKDMDSEIVDPVWIAAEDRFSRADTDEGNTFEAISALGDYPEKFDPSSTSYYHEIRHRE